MKKSYGKFIQVLNRALYIGSAAMLIAGTFLTMTPKMASAGAGGGGGGGDIPQVTLCHSTSSPTNPYNEVTVDDDSIVVFDEKLGYCVLVDHGHGQDPNDIIPAFTSHEGCDFDGQGNQDYLLTGDCTTPVYGCTDPTAFNYNPAANIDDGSCEPIIYGCTDDSMKNYNPDANTDDGSCVPFIYGCTDDSMKNYDPDANTDDGSCIPFIYGCTNPDALNYDEDANTDDGSCIFPPDETPGCMNPAADNYNPDATVDDGTCYFLGCTDPDADNYDPGATQDDGTCFIMGCTDPDADNYDPDATDDDGTCFIMGCTDPDADNYNPDATDDDQSCVYPIVGCMDPEAINYNELATVPDDSCEYAPITGCMDPAATNYDPNATISDPASCKYPVTPPLPLILGVNGYCTGGGQMQWTIENPNDYNLTINSIVVDYGIPITGFSVTPGKHNLLTTPLGTHTVTIYYSDNGEASITNTMEVCPLFIPLLVPVTGGEVEPGYGGGGDVLIPVTGADETAAVGMGIGLGGLSLAGLALVLSSLRKLLHL